MGVCTRWLLGRVVFKATLIRQRYGNVSLQITCYHWPDTCTSVKLGWCDIQFDVNSTFYLNNDVNACMQHLHVIADVGHTYVHQLVAPKPSVRHIERFFFKNDAGGGGKMTYMKNSIFAKLSLVHRRRERNVLGILQESTKLRQYFVTSEASTCLSSPFECRRPEPPTLQKYVQLQCRWW